MRTETERGIVLYRDGGRDYLELYSGRAPIRADGYYGGWTGEDVDVATAQSIVAFEERHGVTILLLGRSGRHVCIEDVPRNRSRYHNLRRAAEAAARRLWQSMRD